MADARLPTGNEEEFTGAGNLALRGLAIVSGRFGNFSPHLNVGYMLRTGEGRKDVASPVGIVQASSETLEAGFREYLGILALISLSLALLNLLPLLPLDGGHIAFALAERVRGRAIPRAAYERASVIGIFTRASSCGMPTAVPISRRPPLR